jgi:hypothetical protein
MAMAAIGLWAVSMAGAVIAAEQATAVSGDGSVVTASSTKDGQPTVITMIRKHGPDEGSASVSCSGETNVTDTTTESVGKDGKKERVRLVMCAKGAKASVDVAERLAEARKRLAEDESLSSEIRQKVLSQLDNEIARLKAPPSPLK